MDVKSFRYLGLLFSSNDSCPFYIYFKGHKVVKDETGLIDEGKTIFVGNVPLFLNEDHIKLIFSKVAPVSKVIRCNNQNELKMIGSSKIFAAYLRQHESFCSYIVFKDKITSESINNLYGKGDVIKLYEIEGFNIESLARRCLKNQLATCFEPHQLEKEALSLRHSITPKTDDESKEEEGWIALKHRCPSLPKLPFKSRKLNQEPKKENELDGLHLYSFMRQQAQEEKISMLRQKFEEDKLKVVEMRKRRKFRPLI